MKRGEFRMMASKKYPNIEAERARHGLSVQKLSEILGVSRKTYYNWISKGQIPQNKLISMAELFGTSISYLLEKTSA